MTKRRFTPAYPAELRERVGVGQALVIAGDPEEPVGPFGDSMAVLETGVLEERGMKTIFVGGQPEGIPGVSGEAVSDALDWKHAYAKESPAAFRLVTQFVLDSDNLMAWRRDLDARGIDLPIAAGIMPIHNFKQVARFAGSCGARIPDWLAKRFEGLEDDPETARLVAAGAAVEQMTELIDAGVKEFHFYTLNRAEVSLAICRALGLPIQTGKKDAA